MSPRNTHKVLPIQALLNGEYVTVARLHKDIHQLSETPHRHDHYEMLICTEGQGNHWIDFKEFQIKPGRLFFIQKDQVHIIENFDRAGWLVMFGEELYSRFLKMHIHEDENGILDRYTAPAYVDLDEKILETFQLIIDLLAAELRKKKWDSNIVFHYVSLLLLYANREHMVQYPGKQLELRNKQTFHEIKHLIEKHFRQEHQASFYALTLKMDIKKLNLICRQATGNTLFELLQQRLITESKIELQTTSSSIKTISYRIGFNDPAFFGRFFKKHTGETPASFRARRLI